MDAKRQRPVQIEHIINFLPKSTDILPPVPMQFQPSPGLLGFTDLLTVSINLQISKPMIREAIKEHAHPFTKDDLRVISGAALQHYWAHEVQASTKPKAPSEGDDGEGDLLPLVYEGSYFNTFGGPESIGYYTGWRVKETYRLPDNEYIAKLCYELASGRAVITTIKIEGMWQPALVTGYQRSGDSFSFKVATRKSTRYEGVGKPSEPVVAYLVRTFAPRTSDIQRMDLPEDGPLHNYVLEVCPPTKTFGPSLSQEGQREVLIEWAVKHAQAQRAFFPETWHTYHAGTDAWNALLLMTQSKPEEEWSMLPSFLDHVQMLVLGRKSVATAFRNWIELGEEAGLSRQRGETLGIAGGLFEEVSERLLAKDYRGASEVEKSAFQALKRVVVSA